MATSKEFIQNFLVGLDLGGVRVRPMMGEYVLYFDEKPVGCICDGQVFVKITTASRKILDGAPEIPPYGGAKPRFLVTEQDKEFLLNLFSEVAKEVSAPKKKR